MRLTHRARTVRSSLALVCATALATFATPARADVCGLAADVNTISLSSGAIQRLRLSSPENPGAFVQMFGSFGGTSPGISALGEHFPLNTDRYFLLTYSAVSPLIQSDSSNIGGFALLDAQGVATMRIVAPPALHAQLVGRTVHHAFAMQSATTLLYECVSNPVALTFAP